VPLPSCFFCSVRRARARARGVRVTRARSPLLICQCSSKVASAPAAPTESFITDKRASRTSVSQPTSDTRQTRPGKHSHVIPILFVQRCRADVARRGTLLDGGTRMFPCRRNNWRADAESVDHRRVVIRDRDRALFQRRFRRASTMPLMFVISQFVFGENERAVHEADSPRRWKGWLR